jgi:hypothetical protein
MISAIFLQTNKELSFSKNLQTDVETRATQSVRVPVRNLKRADPSININRLQEALGWEFLRRDMWGNDGGMETANQQRGFQMVRPEDGWFPGLDKLKEDLQSHQWIFGKTPKFKVNRECFIFYTHLRIDTNLLCFHHCYGFLNLGLIESI